MVKPDPQDSAVSWVDKDLRDSVERQARLASKVHLAGARQVNVENRVSQVQQVYPDLMVKPDLLDQLDPVEFAVNRDNLDLLVTVVNRDPLDKLVSTFGIKSAKIDDIKLLLFPLIKNQN